jgi:tetratricopeptide (TPR) repeat protein
MASLQKKTNLATNEPFVFIQIKEDTNPSEQFDGDEYSVYQTAIRIKNEGNDDFRSQDFKKAAQAYGDAIALLLSLDVEKCGRDLAICYQNRAAAYEHLRKIMSMIDDATKAIEADKTYAKGYFRRARGYVIEKKFYLALQDIVWACILDRFHTVEYNKMAATLNSPFGKLYIRHLYPLNK